MAETMKSLESDGIFKSDVELETEEEPRRVRGFMRGRPLLFVTFWTVIAACLILWIVLATSTSNTSSMESESPSKQQQAASSSSSAGDGTFSLPDDDSPYADCDYACQNHHPDRIGHNVHLARGQAVCSEQFRFGLSDKGEFFWKDCESGETTIFATRPNASYWTMC
jgi:hypothetical protein